jgi:hypothetical protein
MNRHINDLINDLNHEDVKVRLESLELLKRAEECGQLEKAPSGNDINNHIHTKYSFSPYSPAKAAWMGYRAGLCTAGIMDHDSIGGAEEFIAAGRILGLPTTIGVECRVDFSNTPLAGKRINNPDQKSNVYMALHGIPHTAIDEVDAFFRPFREERIKRNRLMVDRINEIIGLDGLYLDFDRQILPLSNYSRGGTVTERHILYGLSLALIDEYGKGSRLLGYLKDKLMLNISPKVERLLGDDDNIHYAYDLLGALKSDMVSRFYIDAKEECPDVREVLALCSRIGAISAYAYLGDVGDSVTGDKKAQKFEDDYLEELFLVLEDLGFNAVTYMPSRNTMEQLKRVKALCNQHGFFQISGEDINSPRQPFICEALRNEEFANLYESTWALIGHELSVTRGISRGMFTEDAVEQYPDLEERIKEFARIGRELT